MKKLFVIAWSIVGLSSCTKQDDINPSVLVKETCCAPIYYAEIIHKNMYKVGDTIRIQFNQMPQHELSYPSKQRHLYTTVVIVKI